MVHILAKEEGSGEKVDQRRRVEAAAAEGWG